MKKKYIISVVLITATFISCVGCGSKDKIINIEAENQSINQSVNQDTDESKNQSINQDTAQSTNQSENQDSNQAPQSTNQLNNQNPADTSDVTIQDNLDETDKQNEEETNADKITAFGNKATMNNNVGGRELPIYCVDTEENKVALSFDAAWGAEDTKEILDILKKHDIHVTFFATGGWVESYPDDVKAVLEAGHDLGNHSENHKNMSELSDSEKEEELMAVHRSVKELTGYDMFLFRPPYGDYDNSVINVAKDCGYYAIQWDVDSLDWKNYGVDSIIETVTEHKNLRNGSIILCHNGAEYTAEALDTLIDKLEEQGYEIVPISELIYKDDFHLNYEGRQIAD